MIITLEIPVSPDQEDAIADHLFEGKVLGMVSDERAWMIAHAHKAHPSHRIKSADLDLKKITWLLELEPRAPQS